MAEQVNQKHRDKKIRAMTAAKYSLNMPSNKFGLQSSLERVTVMSPAAQKLLTSRLGVRHDSDKALRASYTPTPGSSTPGAARTPRSAYLTPNSRGTTPKILKQKKSASAGGLGEGELSTGLTDNLLDLPRRPKVGISEDTNTRAKDSRMAASDFF